MDDGVQIARKTLLSWSGLVTLVALVGFSFLVSVEPVSTFRDIAAGAPLIRVYPMAVGLPLFVVALYLLYIPLIIKALPALRVPNWVGKVMVQSSIGLFFVTLLVVVISLFVARSLQHYYFHKNGYAECDQLQGNPTIWFSDWVKNPAWCVKGKDREWVFEQARIAEQSKSQR
jgi:hypothetical protein